MAATLHDLATGAGADLGVDWVLAAMSPRSTRSGRYSGVFDCVRDARFGRATLDLRITPLTKPNWCQFPD
jgi:hypothetical protein